MIGTKVVGMKNGGIVEVGQVKFEVEHHVDEHLLVQVHDFKAFGADNYSQLLFNSTGRNKFLYMLNHSDRMERKPNRVLDATRPSTSWVNLWRTGSNTRKRLSNYRNLSIDVVGKQITYPFLPHVCTPMEPANIKKLFLGPIPLDRIYC